VSAKAGAHPDPALGVTSALSWARTSTGRPEWWTIALGHAPEQGRLNRGDAARAEHDQLCVQLVGNVEDRSPHARVAALDACFDGDAQSTRVLAALLRDRLCALGCELLELVERQWRRRCRDPERVGRRERRAQTLNSVAGSEPQADWATEIACSALGEPS
jgi:hypothetical protein